MRRISTTLRTPKTLLTSHRPTSWVLSSVPSMFPEQSDKTTLSSGYNRALLAWYNIDPLFTRRSSSLTPAHIKGDLEQLSNYYVREVYVKELFPNRDNNSYSGATAPCLYSTSHIILLSAVLTTLIQTSTMTERCRILRSTGAV